MAVKFSQFIAEALSSPSFLVGYNSITSQNTKVSYADLVTAFSPGSGTTNYLSKWTSSSALGNSLVFDNGTNVGIGTTSPVNYSGFTTLAINNATSGGLIDLMRNGSSQFRISTDATQSALNSAANLPLTFFTNNTERVRIDINGNLGVGTNSISSVSGQRVVELNASQFPTLRLSTAGLISEITANTTSGWLSIATTNNYPITFLTNNTERARITAAGRLLLGTAVESTYELDVVGDIRSTLDANINGLTVGKGGGSVASNTAFGNSALSANTTGSINTAIGFTSLRDNTTGFQNTAVGNASGRANNGNNNTYLGFAAGIVNATGGNNTIAGAYSGYALNGGSGNTLLGYFVGGDIIGGGGNTIVGENTGRGITTGNNNTIIGAGVTGLSSSLSNTIILADGQGNQRLVMNSTLATIGTDANINGLTVGKGTGSQAFATAFGVEAMTQTVTGNFNTGIGYRALRLVTSGSANTTLGYNSGAAITTGAANTIIGSSTGTISTGGENTVVGANIGITTGSQNTVVGAYAANVLTTGGNNTFMGWYAGVSATTSSMNTGIGRQALGQITTGANNTALGSLAGRFFGASTSSNTTSSNSIYLGYSTRASADGNTNETVIGYDALGNGSNSVTLGNTSVTKTVLQSGVLVGTTTSAGYALDVNGTARVKGSSLVVGDGSTTNQEFLDILGATNAAIRYYKGATHTFTTGTGNWSVGNQDFAIQNIQTSTVAFFIGGNNSHIGIGTTSPNASALVDITSTTKGFLPPRMTNAQMVAIVTPAAGLMVYDTTSNKVNVYDGSAWTALH